MNIGLTVLEERMLEGGFDDFTLADKNQLIATIARKEQKAYYEITADYLLDYHKKLKKESLSLKCEEEIIKGFTSSNGHRYRLNRDDQLNMMGQKDDIQADDTITIVPWKTEDVGYIEHTVEEWMTVYKEAFAHKKSNLIRYDYLKKKVLDATAHKDIPQFTWDWVEPVVETPASEPASEPASTPEEQYQDLVGDEGNADTATV